LVGEGSTLKDQRAASFRMVFRCEPQLPFAVDSYVHDPDPNVVFEIKVERSLRLEFEPSAIAKGIYSVCALKLGVPSGHRLHLTVWVVEIARFPGGYPFFPGVRRIETALPAEGHDASTQQTLKQLPLHAGWILARGRAEVEHRIVSARSEA